MHFPDHSKYVFSADGLNVSATMIPVEGFAAIEQQNELPVRLLRERETLFRPVHALLYGSQSGRGQKAFAEIVNANLMEEKLAFLLSVVNQWIEGRGLGCAGSDEKLQWHGPWVKEHARKIDWITVGRRGGDDVQQQ